MHGPELAAAEARIIEAGRALTAGRLETARGHMRWAERLVGMVPCDRWGWHHSTARGRTVGNPRYQPR
jgi:hypothetical protein